MATLTPKHITIALSLRSSASTIISSSVCWNQSSNAKKRTGTTHPRQNNPVITLSPPRQASNKSIIQQKHISTTKHIERSWRSRRGSRHETANTRHHVRRNHGQTISESRQQKHKTDQHRPRQGKSSINPLEDSTKSRTPIIEGGAEAQ